MIHSRKAVADEVELQLLLATAPRSMASVFEAAAAVLCLSPEAVRSAVQPLGWCCQAGENLGVSVCDECGEISAGYSAAMGVGEVVA